MIVPLLFREIELVTDNYADIVLVILVSGRDEPASIRVSHERHDIATTIASSKTYL